MIDGVKILQRFNFKDERGEIMHIMNRGDENFQKFGDVYCSTIKPTAIKGWSFHKKATINYVVIRGAIKFVLYDTREYSSTFQEKQEIIIGTENYISVSVPSQIWNAFQCISNKKAYVINFTDLPYDKNEILKMDIKENKLIDYIW